MLGDTVPGQILIERKGNEIVLRTPVRGENKGAVFLPIRTVNFGTDNKDNSLFKTIIRKIRKEGKKVIIYDFDEDGLARFIEGFMKFIKSLKESEKEGVY